jgi:hypothetical protein
MKKFRLGEENSLYVSHNESFLHVISQLGDQIDPSFDFHNVHCEVDLNLWFKMYADGQQSILFVIGC